MPTARSSRGPFLFRRERVKKSNGGLFSFLLAVRSGAGEKKKAAAITVRTVACIFTDPASRLCPCPSPPALPVSFLFSILVSYLYATRANDEIRLSDGGYVLQPRSGAPPMTVTIYNCHRLAVDGGRVL